MMNVLGCLDIPTRGTYLLGGTDVRELTDKELSHIRNKQIGFIFQQYNLIQSLTVLENVELPLIYQGVNADDRRAMALEALARLGEERQILLFTCHSREGEFFAGDREVFVQRLTDAAVEV